MFQMTHKGRRSSVDKDWLAIFDDYRVQVALLHPADDAELVGLLSSNGEWLTDSTGEDAVVLSRRPPGAQAGHDQA
jgi:hypothetical protein